MQSEQRRYLSYLLRLWQIKSEGELVWRMSLENPLTHKRQGFASLEELFNFLEQEIGHAAQGKVSPADNPKATEKGSRTDKESIRNSLG